MAGYCDRGRHMQSITDRFQLGQLAINLGLIDERNLSEALALSGDTGLPVGRVLVMSALMSERDLDNLVRCQTLLREEMVDVRTVAKAMEIARYQALSIDDALYQCGWIPPDQGEPLPLGQLLVDAKIIADDQLEAALKQQEKVNLPLGRVLVLSGVIPEALLTAGINAQIMVRDKKLDRNQAVEALKETKKRQIPLESFLKTKGFYEMPNRNCPRLGELLRVAGLVSDAELITALEHGLTLQKPIGEVLVEAHLVSRTVMESALKLQNYITEGKIRLDQARSILMSVNDGMTFEEATNQDTKPPERLAEARERMSFLTFLENLKQIDESSLESAFEIAKMNTNLVKQILLLGQLTNEASLERAEECYRLALSGKLTMEHSYIVFEYAQRRAINISEALKELNWQQGGPDNTQAASRQPAPGQHLSSGQIVALRDSAIQLDSRGDFFAAREIFEKLLVELVNRDETWYLNCLDALAQTCIHCRDLESAERYSNEALRRKKELFGNESMEAAVAIDGLGKLHYFQQRFSEALDCANEYIRLCRKNLGPEHPHVACGWQNVASVHYARKEIRQAVRGYEIAVDICRKSLGPSHPTTIRLERNYNIAAQALEEAQIEPVRGVGVITGSWRTITVPADAELHQLTSEN